MEKLNIVKIGFLQLGVCEQGIGICIFDKYCYTSYYGFEILK
jgi:hypothetical protein